MRPIRALVAALAVTAITALAPAGAALAQPSAPDTAATGATAAGTATPTASASETASATAQTDGELATVQIDRLTPWVNAKGTLRVSGTLTAKAKISAPQLRLRMSTHSFDSRDSLTSWTQRGGQATSLATAAASPQAPADKKVKSGKGKKAKTTTYRASASSLPKTLRKGQKANFDFTLPAPTLPLDSGDALAAWGPRGLSLDLSGADTQAQDSRQSLRTFTTWYPDPKIDRTRLGVVIPVTAAQYAPGGTVTPAWLEAQAGAGGNLDSLLKSVTANPAAILAVDPQLLMSVMTALRAESGKAATANPQTRAATAGATATANAEAGGTRVDSASVRAMGKAQANDPYPHLRAWWRQLAQAADGKRVLALPWADADLGALHTAKLSDQAGQARKSRAIVAQFFPGARTDTAWPRSGALGTDALASALSAKGTLLLSDLQAATNETYTTNSRSTVSGTDADGEAVAKKNVLVTDSGLESLAAARAAGGPDSALATAELAAASAAITAERPFAHRTVLMTLPRTAAATGWSAVSAMPVQLPWLDTADLKALTDTEATPRVAQAAKQTDAGQAAARAQHATGTALKPLRKPVADARAFSAVFSDASRARARNDRAVLSCASVGWDDPAAAAATSEAGAAWKSSPHPTPTPGADGQQPARSMQDQPITSDSRAACIDRLRAGLRELQNGITVERSSSVLLVTGEKTTIPVRVENTTQLPATFKATLTTRAPGLKTGASESVTVDPGESARVEVPVEGIANSDVTAAVRLLAADGAVVVDRSSMVIRVRADWENIGTAVIGAALLFVFLFGLVKAVRKGKRKIPEDQLDAALARGQERDSQ